MVLVGGAQARAERARGRSSSRACASPTATATGSTRSRIRRVARRSGGAAARARLVRGRWRRAARPPARPRPRSSSIRCRASSSRALEAELSHTKENLQAAIEELETSNEELQAANEELQASNEELQSTNEELQSVNEELYTVNAEYQRKIARADRADQRHGQPAVEHRGRHDLPRPRSSGSASSRRRSPRRFNLRAARRRPVDRDLRAQASIIPELVDDLRRVLASGAAGRARAARRARASRSSCASCPTARRARVDGVVLTLIDVSGLKAAEDALFHERYLLNSLLASVPDAIYFKDARGRFIRANHAMAARLGLDDPRDAVGQDRASSCPTTRPRSRCTSEDEAVLRTRRGAALPARAARRAPDGAEAWDLVTRLPLRDRDGAIVGIIAHLPRRHRAEARRGEDPGGGAAARPVPGDALARAAQSARRDRHRDRAAARADGRRSASRRQRSLDDPRAAVAADGAPARRSARGEPRHAEQDRAAQARRRPAHGRRAKPRTPCAAQMEARGLELHGRRSTPSRSASTATRRGCSRSRSTCSATPRSTRRAAATSRSSVEREDGRGRHPRARRRRRHPARDMLESVFDLFVQSSRTLDRAGGRARRRAHAGALARRDARRHGHRAQRRRGQGQRVRRAAAAAPRPAGRAAQSTPPARPRSARDRRQGRGRRGQRRQPRDALRAARARRASSATRRTTAPPALRARSTRSRPDVAILDVGLPEMDGFEVARRIRANPRHAGIVPDRAHRLRAGERSQATAQAGFDEHLVKPVHAVRTPAVLHGPGLVMPPRTIDIGVSGA